MNTQPLHGRLEDVHFSELLLTISQRKESGVLHVVRHNIEKDVYFHDGRIIFAKSNDLDERLGELCLRTGKISLRQLEECAKKVVPGLRLGTILVQEGYLRASDLYQGVIHQVEAIVYSLFEWSDGTFEFNAGELPTKEVITLSISTPDIILAGIGKVWRWSWIHDWVGPLETLYVRKEDWETSAKKMSLSPEIESIMALLEKPRPLEELLNTSTLNNFETCKLLWALLIIGIIQPSIPRTTTLQMPFEPEVTSDIFSIEMDSEERAPWPKDDTPPLARRASDKKPVPKVPVSHPILEKASITPEEAQVRVEPIVADQPFDNQSVLEPPNAEQIAFATENAFFVTELSGEPFTRQIEDTGTNEIPIPSVIDQDTESAVGVEEEPMAPAFLIEGTLTVAPVEVSFSDLAEASQSVSEPLSEPLSISEPQKIADNEPSDRWEQGIATDVNNFNEVHRFLFEMLRMELGQSVANFLQRILNKASAQHPLVFDGVKMNEFGELDRSALESNIQGNLADRYSEAFDFLLQEEREMMQTYLDRKRAESIQSGLNRILEKQKLPT